MNARFAFFAILALFSSLASAQRVALTFDDGLDPGATPQATEWNDKLLASLRAAGAKSMIFPSLRHTGGSTGHGLVQKWSDAGHDVGNHTSRHRNFGSAKVSLEDFIVDVVEADEAFRGLPTWVRALRFPYLKEGETRDKRDGMRRWMAKNGYVSAPVSIDTSDWYFNAAFLRLQTVQDEARLVALRDAYVHHILDRSSYYDELARKLLGRSPRHVMLLHVNAINAHFLPHLIEALRQRGWAIVAPAEAFADPLYRMTADVLPAGESIVWSVAKAAGVSGLRYPAEDSIYEEPALRRLGLGQ